jgi:hypothetical protein
MIFYKFNRLHGAARMRNRNQEVSYEMDDPKFADYYRRPLCR